MSQKEQIMFLIKGYYAGNYRTSAFCDEFTRILCMEQDGSLTKNENLLFLKCNEVFSRFSPYDEDIKSGFLFGEDKIQQEFQSLIKKLNLNI